MCPVSQPHVGWSPGRGWLDLGGVALRAALPVHGHALHMENIKHILELFPR